MNQTNLLAALALASFVWTNSVRTTNWNNTGERIDRREGITWQQQWLTKITTTEERWVATPTIVWVTNHVTIRETQEPFSKTNTVIQMNPTGPPPLPQSPGTKTKE